MFPAFQTDIFEDSLRNFEDPEQSQSPQHTDTKGGPRFYDSPNHLEDTTNDHL